MVKERYLVTTANKKSWDKNKPLLFLGKWCTLYKEKEYWENIDYEIAPYHWDDRNKLFEDYQYTLELLDRLLPIISSSLNKAHGINRSDQYWRIIIGPWLGYFIQIMIDRWSMIDSVFSKYRISGTTALSIDVDSIIPKDMSHFLSMIEEDIWNHVIYTEIIQFKGLGSILASEECQKNNGYVEQKGDVKASNRQSILSSFLFKVNGYLTKNNEFFFIDYPLGKKQIILDFLLGQITNIQPINRSPRMVMKKINVARVNLLDEYTPDNEFESFLSLMLCKHMPVSYLEGYSMLKDNLKLINWPQHPKVIVCSNAHNANELFKVWVAEQKEKHNSKLVIAQHGGNYGSAKWNFFEDLELNIADYYFSWGWRRKNYNNIFPMPPMKIERYRKKLSTNKNGRILIVTGNLPRYSYFLNSLPIGPQVEEYFKDMFNLVSNFDRTVFKETVVRIYPFKDYSWSQKERWINRFPEIKFDDASNTMYQSINNSRLVVGTYNATTILETLSADVPTVLYWDTKYFEIRESAEEYFELLREAKILHHDASCAAEFINCIWSDVDEWWDSEKVKNTRKVFCAQYSMVSNNALSKWKKMLVEISDQTLENTN